MTKAFHDVGLASAKAIDWLKGGFGQLITGISRVIDILGEMLVLMASLADAEIGHPIQDFIDFWTKEDKFIGNPNPPPPPPATNMDIVGNMLGDLRDTTGKMREWAKESRIGGEAEKALSKHFGQR